MYYLLFILNVWLIIAKLFLRSLMRVKIIPLEIIRKCNVSFKISFSVFHRVLIIAHLIISRTD